MLTGIHCKYCVSPGLSESLIGEIELPASKSIQRTLWLAISSRNPFYHVWVKPRMGLSLASPSVMSPPLQSRPSLARSCLAETAGREHILFLFQHIDLSSVMEFIEIWGNHFDAYEHRYNGRMHFYTLHHDVNSNYSQFIKEYVTALIQNTIPRTVRFEEVGPNAVTFSFEA